MEENRNAESIEIVRERETAQWNKKIGKKGCHKIDKKWKNHKFGKEFMIFFGKWKKVVIKQ